MAPFSLSKIAAIIGLFSSVAASSVPLANRNGFIDPRIDYWATNSAALATAGGYSAAYMYLAGAGTGGAGTTSWVDVRTVASVQAVSEASARLAFVHNQTTASTGTVSARTAPFTLMQRIEDVSKYAGRSVTLSYKLWLASGGPITIPAILAQQFFGTGGSPSTAVSFDKNVNWTITTTPKKFSVRLDVPSITSKTIGTNGNDYLVVGLWLPPGVTFGIVGIEPQIEYSDPQSSPDINGAGGSPTTFEWRGEAAEQSRSDRYYQVYTNFQVATYTGGGGSITTDSIPLRAIMRAVPAVGQASTSTSNCTGVNISANQQVAVTFLTGCSASTIAFTQTTMALDARL